MSEVIVERLFQIMGRDYEEVEWVAAGNVFGVMGVAGHLLKFGTLSSSLQCPSMGMLNYGQ